MTGHPLPVTAVALLRNCDVTFEVASECVGGFMPVVVLLLSTSGSSRYAQLQALLSSQARAGTRSLLHKSQGGLKSLSSSPESSLKPSPGSRRVTSESRPELRQAFPSQPQHLCGLSLHSAWSWLVWTVSYWVFWFCSGFVLVPLRLL